MFPLKTGKESLPLFGKEGKGRFVIELTLPLRRRLSRQGTKQYDG
jgi:hypothetical protein